MEPVVLKPCDSERVMITGTDSNRWLAGLRLDLDRLSGRRAGPDASSVTDADGT